LSKNGFDSGLHASTVGTNNEQIKARLIDLCPEPDGFEGALLADKPIDRLEVRSRRKLQAGGISLAIELIDRQGAQRLR
jgi:hypothetical protein